MKCTYCQNAIYRSRFNWCYMIIGEEQVLHAHLICIQYEQAMERIEAEEYLLSALSF